MQTQLDGIQRELDRIAEEYQERAAGRRVAPGTYSLFNEAALLHVQSVERAQLALLRRHGFTDLGTRAILDVGCGGGMHLRRLLDYGAQPEHLVGIDLLPQRVDHARHLNPAITWLNGSAHELPFADASFDIVSAYTVFSSILSASLRRQIAIEMWRVLRPGGLILLYDLAVNNPRNPAVRRLHTAEIHILFARPGAHVDIRRVTLAPPIARRLAPHSAFLVNMLEHLKVLNTHLLAGIIREPSTAA